MLKIAIIILVYNGRNYLPSLLSSLNRQKNNNLKVEIIIVDNNSSDDSIKYIEDNFPEIRIINNERNLGFAEGNNIGIKYALDKEFDFVGLLNQDIIVDENWLEPLIDRLKSSDKIAAVQPKIMHWPEKEKINSYGNILHYLGFGFTSFNGEREEEVKSYPRVINYASGAAVIFKSNALRKVGLFDKSFFMYHEDTDLSLRMKLSGFQIEFVPDSKVFHQYVFSKSIKKFYFIERNRFIILLKFYKILTLIIILPALIFLELGLIIQSLFNGFFLQRLKVYIYFLNPLNLINILRKRFSIQSQRIIKDRDIFKELSGEIKFQEIDNFFLKFIFNPVLRLYKQIIQTIIIW